LITGHYAYSEIVSQIFINIFSLGILSSKLLTFFLQNCILFMQWFPREASGPITHATYSCDSQSIYVSFEDGSVGVLTASTLRLRCRINSTAYLPPNPRLLASSSFFFSSLGSLILFSSLFRRLTIQKILLVLSA